MKIVVLDGYTLNPGDLSWSEFEKLGDLTLYGHTPFNLTYGRAKDAEIVITNKTPIDKELIDRLERVKYIGLLSTGYNVVDYEYAKQKNIIVTNIPSYSTNSVMQLVFAYILHFANLVKQQSDSVFRGDWSKSRDFCYYPDSLIELSGKTIGIIGFGRIGSQVAKTAEAFGMKVLAYSRSKKEVPIFVEMTDLNTLLSQSDFITLHCPLFPETTGIINKETLGKMKETAILINTARGPLVVDDDLAEALDSARIRGAALDVLTTEPPSPNNPLLKAKNCIITPHTAWATKEARTRLMKIAGENLKMFLEGKPQNVVNK